MTDPAVLPPAGAHSAAGSARPARVITGDTGAVATPTRRKPRSHGRLAAAALGVAMIALSASWFSAWALPFAVLAILLALVALLSRRARRDLAWWALGLGVGAVACSMFWVTMGVRAAAEVVGR
ncbi:hypothetical protein [Microbacterium sp. JZ31]|uniref:hypothetical protein n=1 Tax=Microbacterium sp. JZ31 TaxID=1906274 RepID=UPI001932A371|nr:hypothetical protein [Microbacterium sp. JZ31]